MTAKDASGRMTAKDTSGGVTAAAHPRAVLAVDGGQSGIRLRHSGAPDVVVAQGVSRAGDTVAAVARIVDEALGAAGFPPADRVVLGLTTAPTGPDDAHRLCSLVAASAHAAEVWLADDTVTSHCGALSGGAGASLAVGTGVACLAVPETGSPRVFDGHGYLLGDEGGAFWIGRRALAEVLRARDRGEAIALSTAAESRYGDLGDLHVRLHDSASAVNEIAQFARDVLEAAGADPVAAGILDEAARRILATAGAAVAHLIERDGAAPVPLALGGRMLEPGSPLRARVDALLPDLADATPRSADADPLAGALLLGAADTPDRYRGLVHLWNERNAA